MTPADQALAVGDGPNPILQVVNACLSVWRTNGTRIIGPVSLQTFFGLPASTAVFDPRALFDWYNHRFIVIATDTDGANSNNINIAVSRSDDPAGLWWTYRIPVLSQAGALADYPRLGQDRTSLYPGFSAPGAIYVASNLFSNSTGAYLKEEWLVLPKGPMYAGAGFSFVFFSGMTSGGVATDTSQPVNVWSPYEQPRAGFFITSKNIFNGRCLAPCNGLTVWAVSNPFGFVSGGDSPELSSVVIPTANNYSFPPDAPQPGGPNTIDTIDTRISGTPTYAHGHIHAALVTANGTGGVASIIYKVQPFLNATNGARCTTSVGLCPQITGALIRNESVVNYGGTNAAFFPTPQPDLDGNVTTVLSYSSTAFFPSLIYISQRVTQPVGTFVDSGWFLAVGLGQYTQGRWGDYTAVAPAGVFYASGDGGATGNNGMAFAGMYAGTPNRWRTRIGYTLFNAPGQH
ncbi:MAG: hypothetical protein OER43_10825 [Gammaproteobacteria bacterium]|nr:hypothetical protein [Gammaproteobacteria bacterium]